MQTTSALYRGKNDQAPRPVFTGPWRLIFKIKTYLLADALPGLAAAEHAAECAALHLQGIRPLHRDRRVVIAARVRIVDLAGPFRTRRLHADQDLLAGLHGI